MPAPTSIAVQAQQFTHDCGVAALAMVSGQPYMTVCLKAQSVSPTCLRTGLWLHEVVTIAQQLGLQLKYRNVRAKGFQLDDVTGILMLRHPKTRWGHLVVMFQGVLVDPSNGGLWDADVYIQNHASKPTTFLEIT